MRTAYKKKRRVIPFIIGVSIFLLLFMLVTISDAYTRLFTENNFTNSIFRPISTTSDERFSSIRLHSSTAILLSLSDNQVLLDKNSDQTIYPASLTKIMTCLVAIESLEDLQAEIALPSWIFPSLYDADAAMAGFLPDERIQAIDLLYGVMLPSGAECSIGLAEAIAGSEDAFVERMNEKAQTLAMNSTHFTNASGLHDANHYSTARDLSVLLRYALENEVFRTIFTTEWYASGATNIHPDGVSFYSTLHLQAETLRFNGGNILGGKTGYTSEAGQCLASLAVIEGEEYILITAGAQGNYNSSPLHIEDALTIYGSVLG